MKDKILVLFAFITVINSLLIVYSLYKTKELECAAVNSVFAERKYVYPALRELDKDPDEYGKEIKNPLTTKNRGC